jgi:ornithine carbamoyltransferase
MFSLAIWMHWFCALLMKRVTKSTGTIFMHDLPAVRNEEASPEVLDGPQSIALPGS